MYFLKIDRKIIPTYRDNLAKDLYSPKSIRYHKKCKNLRHHIILNRFKKNNLKLLRIFTHILKHPCKCCASKLT